MSYRSGITMPSTTSSNKRTLPRFGNNTAVDFVIVGAGGAGGIIAKELSTSGFQVVMLEQGPYFREQDFVHDELKYKEPLNVPSVGQETLTNDHVLQPNTLRRSEREKATLAYAIGYGRCVG